MVSLLVLYNRVVPMEAFLMGLMELMGIHVWMALTDGVDGDGRKK